jgi:hypothetical protein
MASGTARSVGEMRGLRSPRIALIAGLFGCCGGCASDSPFQADAATDPDALADADGDSRDAKAPSDVARDDSLELDPGPLTFVVSAAGIALDRLCDFDGDGLGDNAIADLGEPGATLLAMGMGSLLDSIVAGGRRELIHAPWIENRTVLSDSDTVITIFEGDDVDESDDTADDFSGLEPYYVKGRELDACGEPLYAFEHARLERAELTADRGSIPIPFSRSLPGRHARLEGSVTPDRAELSLRACAVALIGELGGREGPDTTGGLTMLELFLVGGGALGFPDVPGIAPDVDLDGDGLERLILDERGRLESCVDGDSSPIAGSDCYRDLRMADGFGLVAEFTALPAVFAGREPDWQVEAPSGCDAGPPDASLFDPR